MNRPDTAILSAWSNQLAALVEQVAANVVAIHVGRCESISGVVWRDGLIVTAAHALGRVHDIALTLPDGTRATAQLAGADGSTDLAALRFDSLNAPPLASSDAAAVQAGHWVMAVARNARNDVTVDHGLIARAGGAWQTWRGGRIDRLLRLDGALAASFAGAPIVSADGSAIGIGTPALARGYGIAIPTSTVNRVVDELLAKGRIMRGWFGVSTQTVALSETQTKTLALADPHGALVTSIAEDSPAAQGGLLLGDILIDIDGQRVTDIESVQAALAATRVGQRVTTSVVRAGQRLATEVTVGERPRAHC